MIDWDDQVGRPHWQCAVSGETIPPGAPFYSVLRWQGGAFHRVDIAAEAWTDACIEGAVSWWRLRRPEAATDSGPRLLSPEILFGIFNDLRDARERPRQCLAWLLALLLVRLRSLRYLDIVNEGDDAFLVVQVKGKGARPVLRIRDPRMTPHEEQLLQEQLDQLFTAGGVVEAEDVGDRQPSGDGGAGTDELEAADKAQDAQPDDEPQA